MNSYLPVSHGFWYLCNSSDLLSNEATIEWLQQLSENRVEQSAKIVMSLISFGDILERPC